MPEQSPQITTDAALDILRRRTASSPELEAALAAIDTRAAEAEVDALERDRRRLLANGAADKEIDFLDEKIRTGNRRVERLFAAREDLPGRISARKDTERAVAQRGAAARKLLPKAFAAFVEMHQLAERLAELLAKVRHIDSEIGASNLDAHDAGISEAIVNRPIKVLADHLGCPESQLPRISEWKIDGYLARLCLDDRLLDRAAELLKPPATKAA